MLQGTKVTAPTNAFSGLIKGLSQLVGKLFGNFEAATCVSTRKFNPASVSFCRGISPDKSGAVFWDKSRASELSFWDHQTEDPRGALHLNARLVPIREVRWALGITARSSEKEQIREDPHPRHSNAPEDPNGSPTSLTLASSLLLDWLQVLLTLFPESFALFDRSTCALSVPCW